MIKDSKRIPKMTAGLDLGDKHSYLCLIDTDTGQLVEESHLRNTPDSAELAKAYPTPQQRRVAVPKHDLLHRLKRGFGASPTTSEWTLRKYSWPWWLTPSLAWATLACWAWPSTGPCVRHHAAFGREDAILRS